jgi:hypothetical protein
MKNYFKIASYLFVALLVTFSACKKKGDDTDPRQEKIEQLSFTWTVDAVTADGDVVDVSATNASFTFSGNGTYNVAGLSSLAEANLNNSDVLSGSGSWEFNSELTAVTLDDDASKVLTIITLNESTLEFSYQSAYIKETDPAKTIRYTCTR